MRELAFAVVVILAIVGLTALMYLALVATHLAQ